MFGGFEDLKAIGINLLSNAISFAFGLTLGLVVTSSRKLFRPSFWSKMRSSKVIIVVGAHATFDEYEASGLIGTGDALALAEFISYFKQSGFKNYEVVSSRTISTTMLGENLILIGGPDANTTSRDFIERSRDRLRTQFGDPDKSEISFKLSGITFMPELGDTLKDAAAIVYQRNPYANDRHVILVSGCYGHGTEAAAKLLCRSSTFASKTRWASQFEAAITCEIVGHGPTAAELKCLVK